jgi:PHP family Zn ribbon phosphoesterase
MPYNLVGSVEEVASRVQHSSATGAFWHYSCRRCGQRLRMPASRDIEFDCKSCGQAYKAFASGKVYAHSVQDDQLIVQPEMPSVVSHPVVNDVKPLMPSSRGGIFGRAMAAILETNEQAHGNRLRDSLASTGQQLKKLDEAIVISAIKGFLEKRAELATQRPNWSREGCIKVGRKLQDQAREKFDFDQSESYALWMAGAWIESGARTSTDAEDVHRTLDELARSMERP